MKRRANHEGSVFQRTDGRWTAKITVPNGQVKAFYARTKAEVIHKLQQAQAQLVQGLPLAGERLTTGALLESWLRDVAPLKVRPRTLQRYQELVRLHIAPSIGRIPLARLQPQDVERMMRERASAGVSPRTVAHCRAVLRNALNVAMKWGHVGRNVASLAAPPLVPQREVRPLSLTDARAILQAANGDRLEALYTVALSLGLRQGEALGLGWGDVDLSTGTLRVQRSLQRYNGAYHMEAPKTARARRTIPHLPPAVIATLREHRARQLAEKLRAGPAWQGDQWGNLVFSDEIGGPLSGTSVTHRFEKLLKVAGLPSMRYHDLRHGAASIMAALGVPARTAMEILGHAQISTTMNVYAHVAPEIQRDAMDKVGAALFGVRA